ncbi:hypothetical protein LCGC14_1925130 [marine sediment metagenome]|uniref:Uncharacterized protein n=1 Tax=marine sediment metagenome TaxID=412755 RepID=A0A0F9FQA7_9ZZZZ
MKRLPDFVEKAIEEARNFHLHSCPMCGKRRACHTENRAGCSEYCDAHDTIEEAKK